MTDDMQAFPTDGGNGYINGMTLRDYFAGQAAAGFLHNWKLSQKSFPTLAEVSYNVADALLKERNKK